MAATLTGNPIYLCHFCSDQFSSRANLITHFSHCQIQTSAKPLNEKLLQPPQLHQAQRDILYMVKLQPSTPEFSLNHLDGYPPSDDLNLQIPLSNLYSQGLLPTSPQSTFDDLDCLYTSSPIYLPAADSNSEQATSHLADGNPLTYHIYKYSRRERAHFFARLKRARMKKSLQRAGGKSRSKDISSSIVPPATNFIIQIPTIIQSRQRLTSPSSQPRSPLLFSPHFHTLVKLSSNEHLANYLLDIRISFQLLHSIASQEFQIIVHNYEQQHDFPHASLTNIMRETMLNYATNLHTVFKRNHFQSFSYDEHDLTLNHESELSIPPLKIRRYDDSSYEIEKRSASSSSSSSGMSITQVHNGHQYDDRRRFETRLKKFSSRISDNHVNSNSYDMDKRDSLNITVGSPLQCDSSMMDHSQSKDRTSSESFLSSSLSHVGEQKPKRSTSPVSIKEHSNDSLPKYQSVALSEGARIRIVNCANDSNKHSLSRNPSISSTTTKFTNAHEKVDENWSLKSNRANTRKLSSTNSKTPDIAEVLPTYQAQAVLLSPDEIASNWSTHSVFYRCHACFHEEFFVVLSRECMRLHISSKHGNMEENFKQRISNFLNNQGRALKIFQHYLKWQQPWSEKEIDQIFQLANINTRTNGAR